LRKKKTFIGSSTEGLQVADAIKEGIQDVTDCTIWTDGVFLASHTYIEALEKLLDEIDYAVLVATPDDLLLKRETEKFSMRDNIILELGLYMAKLGRKRTYLLTPRNQPLHIPSDLLGVKTVSYEYSKQKDNVELVQIMAEPCEEIKMAIADSDIELSKYLKRVLVKNILVWTSKISELLDKFKADTIKSILDKNAFNKIRDEMVVYASEMVDEYTADSVLLGVDEQYLQLTSILIETIETVPFPEEAIVTDDAIISGVLQHLLGGKSASDQVKSRMDSLHTRYDEWWSKYNSRLSSALIELQTVLIDLL
jgi:hypothetical protein